MTIQGVDLSRYQGTVDFEQLKAAGIGFVMLRTISTNQAYGGIYLDPTFERNYAECKRLGIPVGVYYYTYARDKATADAELAKLRQALAGKCLEYPVAVDVEDNSLKSLSAGVLTQLVAHAAATIESWGFYAMVYTYTNFAATALEMDALARYDLWIADYRGSRPARIHGMWQYSSTGRVAGVQGNVDLNYAYRDYPALIAAAGLNGLQEDPEQQAAAQTPQLQDLCIVGAGNGLIARARELGLPVELRTAYRIGPASSGDAMTLWQMSRQEGSEYFSRYTQN